MKQADYHTGMVGKWHLGFKEPQTPNARGFDEFKGFLGDMMDDYWTHLRGEVNWMRHNREEINPEGHATELFTQWAIDYMDLQKNNPQPFFLYLAYNAPHFPIQPPEDYFQKVLQRENGIDRKRARNVAFIEHLDTELGKLLDHMRKSGLMENTLIIFTSDNGGALRFAQSNGKLRGSKQQMFEGGIRVPTIASWQGHIKPASETSNVGTLMDLLPTLCTLTGINIPTDVDGINLLPTVLGQPQVTDDRMIFWVRREGWYYGGQAYYGARWGNFKILQNSAYEPLQFYNVGLDPYETTPLEPQDGAEYDSLRSGLRQHIRQSGGIPWQSQK
jgi:arylsulfatase A-like enzyme